MSNRSFVKGLVACLALLLAASGGLYLLSKGEQRPEGIAEDFLTALGDTTRKGVEVDSLRRAEKLGNAEAADRRLLADDTNGKAAFADLEVGKAVRVRDDNPDEVKVGFQVHTRREDETVRVRGVMTLKRTNDEWRETGVELVGDEFTEGSPASILDGLPELPSDGGPPPSSAPLSLWIGGLVGSAVIGAVCSVLIRAAGRPSTLPAV